MKKLILGFFCILLLCDISHAVNLNLISVFDNEDGFVSPAGITSDSEGNFYIADYGKDKILKISKDLSTVNDIVTIKNPLSLVFYQNRLYIVTEADGGFIFDLSANNIISAFGKGYVDNNAYKNIVKAVDIALDTITGILFVLDISDRYIKPYNIDTGEFVDAIGLIGGPISISGDNNGKFFYPTSIAIDNTGKLLVTDTGNCTPYLQLNPIWNPFRKQYVINNKYYGNPKGKVQAFVYNGSTYSCSSSDTAARQFLLHGVKRNEGYTLDVSSIASDDNYVYILDSINKRVFVFDNAVNIFNSNKDLNANPKINYPVAKPSTDDGINTDTDPEDKVGFVRFYGTFGLGTFDNKFVQLKDMVKINSVLAVTDLMGRVFFFYIN